MKYSPDEPHLPFIDLPLPVAPARSPAPAPTPRPPLLPAPMQDISGGEPPRDNDSDTPHAFAAEPPGGAGTAADDDLDLDLADWKADLRRDFEAWLATIGEIPADGPEPEDAADEAPDLYAFYEQFAAAGAESRKANRRTAEAISQWGETLARFESGLQPLRETVAQLTAVQPKSGELSRAHCLMLVELLDRLHRLARAFASPPAAENSWWPFRRAAAWRQGWAAQQQALDILVGHFEALLQKEGVTRIATAGQPFDPLTMMAVAAAPDAARPANSVIEEIAAGYCRCGELLRAAQVKVSRAP